MLPLFLGLALLLGVAGLATSTSASIDKNKRRKPRFTGRKTSDLVTYDIVNDVVVQSPQAIAAAVSTKLGRIVPLSTVALAGAIASESSGPRLAQIGIAWTVKNKAKKDGKSVFATIAPDGKFAAQGTPNHGYIASRLPPTRATLEIAEAVMATPPRLSDPTNGAIQFDSPRAQRAQLAEGLVKKTPEEVAAERRKDGRREVHIPGVPGDELRFWV